MMKLRKMLALLLALLMTLSVLAACASGDGDTAGDGSASDASPSAPDSGADASGADRTPGDDAAESDHTLTIGLTAANTTHDLVTSVMRTQIRMIYEPLFQEDAETGEIVGKLATSYEQPDEQTVVVHLREDVYFTDGQQLTADDVLYSYRDVWGNGNRASYFTCYDWENTRVVDDFTIEFKLLHAYGPVVSYMMEWAIVCADDYVGENPADADKWMSSPNGTGPYVCVENVASSHVTYRRKDASEYWGELPECTEVTYKYYSEASAMYIDFETGGLDVACGISSMDAARVLSGDRAANIGYDVNSINDVLTVALPEETAAFDDIRVRQAFFMAVDRESVAVAMYGDLYIPAESILPANVKYFASQADKLPDYDPEGAKALLAEAGYPDGMALRLVVTQDMSVLAEALQASLSTAGFDVSVESYDPPTAIGMFRNLETDFMCKQSDGGAYINEPGLLVDTMGPNSKLLPCGMEDEAWVEAFTQAQYTIGDASRAAGFKAMQEWAAEQYRFLPLCERANMTVYNTEKLESFNLKCADEPVASSAVFR